MKKLSDEQKAELQAKMERAQRERIRLIGEQSEEGASVDLLSVGRVLDGLVQLWRVIFRRRNSDIVNGIPSKAPRSSQFWLVLLFLWLFHLLLIIVGACLVVVGFMRGASGFGFIARGIVFASVGGMSLTFLLIFHVPMPTPRTARKYKAIRHTQLGSAYRGRGELDKAIAQYESAIGVDTESEGARAAAHYDLGLIYQERGDNEQAIAHFKEFIPLAHSDKILQTRIPKAQEFIQQLGGSKPEV